MQRSGQRSPAAGAGLILKAEAAEAAEAAGSWENDRRCCLDGAEQSPQMTTSDVRWPRRLEECPSQGG